MVRSPLQILTVLRFFYTCARAVCFSKSSTTLSVSVRVKSNIVYVQQVKSSWQSHTVTPFSKTLFLFKFFWLFPENISRSRSICFDFNPLKSTLQKCFSQAFYLFLCMFFTGFPFLSTERNTATVFPQMFRQKGTIISFVLVFKIHCVQHGE